MKPTIKFQSCENFGIIPVYYGHTTEEFLNIENIIITKIDEYAKEKEIIELDILKIDYSIDGFAIVHYEIVKKD